MQPRLAHDGFIDDFRANNIAWRTNLVSRLTNDSWRKPLHLLGLWCQRRYSALRRRLLPRLYIVKRFFL
ncbi:MAG: hypothetical protein VX859_06230 [Pseudomonadota bacterium]|nr:hypothetical protein [Pseudomonadota bacterium]